MEQIFADLCRQLPMATVFCALRLADESFRVMIENDTELWRERRRALLSFVPPHMYPPELVQEGIISVEMPQVDEKEEKEEDQDGMKQDNESNAPPKPLPPPKVTLLIHGKDRQICEAFIKNAMQKWAIEHVMRSWRQQFLTKSEAMEEFWHRKANEREDLEVYGKESKDTIVNNKQIDVQEMYQLASTARRSVAMRIQGDIADKLYEQQAQMTAEGNK